MQQCNRCSYPIDTSVDDCFDSNHENLFCDNCGHWNKVEIVFPPIEEGDTLNRLGIEARINRMEKEIEKLNEEIKEINEKI